MLSNILHLISHNIPHTPWLPNAQKTFVFPGLSLLSLFQFSPSNGLAFSLTIFNCLLAVPAFGQFSIAFNICQKQSLGKSKIWIWKLWI